MALRVAFFGLPLAALLLAEDGHDLVLVAACRRDALGMRRAARRFGDRLLVRPSGDDPALRARLEALAPDLLVSWFWTTRLPMTLVRAARLGGIGVHPSLLPRHRGPDPTTWAILAGDEVTGVTVHRIEADYDTGAILAQERLRIDPRATGWQLARALDRPSLRALRETVRRFARGEAPPEIPQDPALATEAPFLDEEATYITWSCTTDRILRLVRALAPAPGAQTEIAGTFVTVLAAERAARVPVALAPGEGAAIEGRAVVRTGDGAVVLLEGLVEDAGGAERPAGPDDLAALFLTAHPLVLG